MNSTNGTPEAEKVQHARRAFALTAAHATAGGGADTYTDALFAAIAARNAVDAALAALLDEPPPPSPQDLNALIGAFPDFPQPDEINPPESPRAPWPLDDSDLRDDGTPPEPFRLPLVSIGQGDSRRDYPRKIIVGPDQDSRIVEIYDADAEADDAPTGAVVVYALAAFALTLAAAGALVVYLW